MLILIELVLDAFVGARDFAFFHGTAGFLAGFDCCVVHPTPSHPHTQRDPISFLVVYYGEVLHHSCPQVRQAQTYVQPGVLFLVSLRRTCLCGDGILL